MPGLRLGLELRGRVPARDEHGAVPARMRTVALPAPPTTTGAARSVLGVAGGNGAEHDRERAGDRAASLAPVGREERDAVRPRRLVERS